jgi:hypothetical protein
MGPARHQVPLNSTADIPVQRGNDINSVIPDDASRLGGVGGVGGVEGVGGVDWAFEAVGSAAVINEALADGSALRQVLRPDWTQ